MSEKMPSMYQLIEAKKNGLELKDQEIKWIITEYTHKKIPDYQMAAFLMAISLKGMTTAETAALTDAMLYSGRVLSFNDRTVVDKHSTGGIGDKASFVLAPIAACLGVKVPMIAGRGLGHTGGTVDKIEVIKNFKTDLSLDQFAKQLTQKGLVLIGQTPEIAPADRLIYALRDVTATIDCIPLITASIMSKKLAEGAEGIAFDIKYGSGAFMRDRKNAKLLALSLLKTAKRFKRRAVALVTDMNQPLGMKVGHSLELIETVDTLKGAGPKDLTDLSIELAAHMAVMAGKFKTLDSARKKARQTIEDGSALKKLGDLIEWQGGKREDLLNTANLPVASEVTIVKAPKTAYIKDFKNDKVGHQLIELGGGRKTKDDKLDLSVGFSFVAKIGDHVKRDEAILAIHHHKEQKEIAQKIADTFITEIITFSKSKVKSPKLITDVLSL